MPDIEKNRFLGAVNYDLIRENESLRISLTRWQLAFGNLQNMLETAMNTAKDNSDIIEELIASGDDLAQLAANELKGLQEALVIARLDRDYWLSEQQKEKDLADRLYDIIFGELPEDQKTKIIRETIETYNVRRGKTS